MPDVSIVIPCYDSAAFVGEAIDSAKALTGGEVEIVVVNDGSTDGSREAIEAAGGVRLIDQPNRGVSAARNRGLAAATAEFTIFLDADDRLHPPAFERHREGMAHHCEPALVFGSNVRIDVAGREVNRNVQPQAVFDHADVALGTTPSPSQCMYRTEAARAVGGFEERLRRAEDPDLNMRLLREPGATGYCHGEMVMDYRLHPGQATKRPTQLFRDHIAVLERIYGPESPHPDPRLMGRARRHWARYYGQFIPQEVLRGLMRGRLSDAAGALAIYARHAPHTLAGTTGYARRRLLDR